MMKTEQQQHPMTPHGGDEGEVAASPGLPTVASAAAAAAAVAAALRTHPEMHQNAAHMAHGSNMPVQVRETVWRNMRREHSPHYPYYTPFQWNASEMLFILRAKTSGGHCNEERKGRVRLGEGEE